MKRNPLKRLTTVIAGQSPPSANVDDFDGEGLPFLQGNAEFGAESPSPRYRCDTASKRSEPGDILISVRAPVGALNVSDRSYGIGRGLAAVRPGPSIDHRYLWWWLQGAADELRSHETGATYGAVTAEDVGALCVPYCPVPAERAIADFLDAETARIDSLIAKKRQLTSLVSERSIGEQASLACGRTTSDGHRPSRIPWLASVPSHWLEQRLKFIAQVESGHTPSRSRPELWDDCRTPWVTLNDVGYLRTHEYVLATVNQISEAGLAASSARILPRNTVILSRDATVGRCGILGEPMATSQHFVNWICGPALRPRYLWLLLNTAMQAYFASLTAGATLKTIGMPDVKSFMVPLPPLDEQQDIVLRAEHVRQSANRTVGLLQRQINLLRERRQALITAAVTGDLEIPGAAA